VKDALLVGVIRGLSVVPGVKGKIEQENQKIEVMVKNKELDELARERSLTFTRIPARGLDSDSLLSAMRAMRGDNIEKAYAAGKVRSRWSSRCDHLFILFHCLQKKTWRVLQLMRSGGDGCGTNTCVWPLVCVCDVRRAVGIRRDLH
jgi:hypothetical protein